MSDANVTDPLERLQAWHAEAIAAGLPEPDAMTLATATRDGVPSARMVLFRGVRAGGVRFFTNYQSRKGHELEENPRAALVFHWAPLGRQIRVEGRVEKVPADESDEYFHSRPRGSQLGAWASPQSQPIDDLASVRERQAKLTKEYEGRVVPRPPHWGGYRVIPTRIEFWTSGADRLHERVVFEREGEGAAWKVGRVAP